MCASLLLWMFVVRASHPNRSFWCIPRAVTAQPDKEGVHHEVPLESRVEERRECEELCDGQDNGHIEDLKWRRSIREAEATPTKGL